MDRVTGILNVVLPIIAMLAVGMIARSSGLITQEGIGQIKSFVVNFTLPATLFGAFWSMKFTWREGMMVLVMAAVTAIAFAAGFVVPRLLGVKRDITPFLCTTIEGGSIGYAMMILLTGQENLYHFALLDVGNALIQWPVVMTLLQLRQNNAKTGKEIARSLIRPLNIAIVAGILLSATGIGPVLASTPAGESISSVLSFLGSPTGAVKIMTIGYGLTFSHINWNETLRSVASRALIYCVLGIVVFSLTPLIFPGNQLYRQAVLLFFVMPPAFNLTMFTINRNEEEYLSGVLAVYTVLTVIGYAVIAGVTG
ncbi:MAG: hypothetical protein J6S83_03015 [Lachnospiraceae bacterium]|nr:hypothetical protein [Lachnospiraceae bacterium]